MNNLNEVMKPFFDQLHIDPIEFNYNEKLNKYITKESFQYDNNDPESYYLVIKMTNKCGNVILGTSDGISFENKKLLGQIMYIKDHWINL